ncbi:MAG: hypothetical protein G01um101456_323 [Parcubacteria group bacterium Gr01-1014_56]|nr:MAG: hypothetical protein G01um101456_323 [Parcubacteria group bacterium Gr01-1014_56]
MKRRLKDLTKEETVVTLDALYTAASAVKGRDAVKLFLRDLLTPSERIMLGRRIIIARMLISGLSYEDISKRLRVGAATIGRVHHWLKDQFPGFEHAIREMEKEFKKREDKKLYATNALYRLKKKYPLHFLLFSTPKSK